MGNPKRQRSSPARRCEGCHQWFEPDPSKRRKQRYCWRKRCQRKSHQQACQRYRRKNPDDDDSRRPKIRDWARQKGYWPSWRQDHEEYREREKARMRKKRRGARRVAKRDLRTHIFIEELREIQAQASETVAKRDVRDRRVDALLSCLIRNKASQNETHAQAGVVKLQERRYELRTVGGNPPVV